MRRVPSRSGPACRLAASQAPSALGREPQAAGRPGGLTSVRPPGLSGTLLPCPDVEPAGMPRPTSTLVPGRVWFGHFP